MRILFSTWSAPSHLHPMVPLAWACRAAGHEVLVAVPPAGAGAVAAAGLTPVPVGEVPPLPAPSVTNGPNSPGSEPGWPINWPLRTAALGSGQRRVLAKLVARQVGIAEGMLPGLLPFARRWRPELVVSDASTYAGGVTADVLGVPLAHHQWGGPAVLQLEHGGPHGAPLPDYRRLCDRYGADPTRTPDVWIDPCPPSLRMPSTVRRLSVRHLPYHGAGEPDLTAFTAPAPGAGNGSGTPRALVAWEPDAPPAGPLLATTRALAADGVATVLALTAGQRAALPDPPPGVQLIPFSELHLWLPACSLIIHQGNGATGMSAAASGVPQLIVPPRPEQLLTASRLAAVGAARHLSQAAASLNAHGHTPLTDTARAMLDAPAGTFRAAARRLQDEIHTLPTPAASVPALQALPTNS